MAIEVLEFLILSSLCILLAVANIIFLIVYFVKKSNKTHETYMLMNSRAERFERWKRIKIEEYDRSESKNN